MILLSFYSISISYVGPTPEPDNLNHKPLVSIVASTAEWTKFSQVINKAITGKSGEADLEALVSISKAANTPVPETIRALFNKPACQDSVVDKGEIEAEIIGFLQA